MSRFNPRVPIGQSCKKDHYLMPYAFWSEWNSKTKKEYFVLSWHCALCDHHKEEYIDVTEWKKPETQGWIEQAEKEGFINSLIPF